MPDTDFLSQTDTREYHPGANGAEIRIPVIAERISVDKRQVETGRVRISKQVSEHVEKIDVNLESIAYVVEHIAKNEFVEDVIPVTRQEGNTLVIPVLREVMVKRTMLVEEVRITKQTTQRSEQQEVRLRKELVEVTRTPSRR